jgi:hypothetical protein
MKKSITSIALAGVISAFSFNYAHAQFDAKADKPASQLNMRKVVSSDKVNLNAIKNFQHDYKDVTDAEWSVLEDKSFLCRFRKANIPCRASYNPNGRWLFTVSDFSGKQLSQPLHDRVQSVYFNYQITFVNQIDLPDSKTVYLVEIQDEKSIKKVRVTDEDMEVVQDLAKY